MTRIKILIMMILLVLGTVTGCGGSKHDKEEQNKSSENNIQEANNAVLDALKEYEEKENYESIIIYAKQNPDMVKDDISVEKIYQNAIHEYRKAVLTKADGYAQTGDFEQVMIYMNSCLKLLESDVELTVELSIYEQKYRMSVLEEAEKIYDTEGYDAAVKVIDHALTFLEEDEILLEKKEEYKAKAPVALVSLKSFSNDFGGKRRKGVSLSDKLGNSYMNCTEYLGGSDMNWGEKLNTYQKRDIYVIHGEYSLFKATLFVPEDRNDYFEHDLTNSEKKSGSYTFRIFGDDKLLYQSPMMLSKQYPVEIEIDITGVEQLAFSWATIADVDDSVGVANAYLYK